MNRKSGSSRENTGVIPGAMLITLERKQGLNLWAAQSVRERARVPPSSPPTTASARMCTVRRVCTHAGYDSDRRVRYRHRWRLYARPLSTGWYRRVKRNFLPALSPGASCICIAWRTALSSIRPCIEPLPAHLYPRPRLDPRLLDPIELHRRDKCPGFVSTAVWFYPLPRLVYGSRSWNSIFETTTGLQSFRVDRSTRWSDFCDNDGRIPLRHENDTKC